MYSHIYFVAFAAFVVISGEVNAKYLIGDGLLDRDFIEPIVDFGSNVANYVSGHRDDHYQLSPVIDPRFDGMTSHQIIRPALIANMPLGVQLGAPKVEANLAFRGPFGGKLVAGFTGKLAAIKRGIVGALERNFDIRAPFTGAGFGGSSSFNGALKSSPFGLLSGSGSANLERRLHGLAGNTYKAGVRGAISGGLTVNNDYTNDNGFRLVDRTY